MRSYKKTLLLVFILLIAAAITTTATLQNQNNTNPPVQAETGQYQWPVSNHPVPEHANSHERAERFARGERRNTQGLRPLQDSPSLPPFSEQIWASEWDRDLSAIPTTQSDVILLGEITDVHAYLSNDRTSIYSEFTVRVREVIKSDGHVPISSGSIVTVERFGGAIRFPSGRVQAQRIGGQGAPRTGRLYVLFLKRIEQEQVFSIITGYEIRGERVFALDGANTGRGGRTRFDEYNGADAATFLTMVRNSAAQ